MVAAGVRVRRVLVVGGDLALVSAARVDALSESALLGRLADVDAVGREAKRNHAVAEHLGVGLSASIQKKNAGEIAPGKEANKTEQAVISPGVRVRLLRLSAGLPHAAHSS